MGQAKQGKGVIRFKRFLESHRPIVGVAGAALALGVATLYYFVVPEEAERATGVVRFALLYAHSLCWLLLATASTLWALNRPAKLTTILCYAALTTYGIFLAALFYTKLTI